MKDSLRRVFKIKLRQGDMVVVTRGRLKGQKGRVTAIHPSLNKVSVESINMVKKHLKPTKAEPQGGIIEVSRPFWVSKVALLEPETQKASRSGVKIAKDGSRERFYKSSGKVLKESLAIKKASK